MPKPMHAAAAIWLLVTALPAQGGIRVVKVPDAVRLPATPGTNLLLEVEIDGAPGEVWLASDAASRDRVPLSAAGAGRWQQNLAEPRVAAMLPAGRDEGALFVFAKVGGDTARSAPIAWARLATQDGKVRCLLRGKHGATTIVGPDKFAWLDPSTLERLELIGAAARQSAVVARFGELEQPLSRREEVWVLEGGASLRERLGDQGAMEIEVRLGADRALFSFAIVPGRLPPAEGGAKFVVQQRGSAGVPGGNGWLIVHIDDITMGATLLDVSTADGKVLVAPQNVHERDAIDFALADERYVLVVDKLLNRLIGEDHAELRVVPEAGFERDRIGLLIRAVGASKDTFVREGVDYAGPMAQQFLIARLGSHRGQPPSVDEFIDTLASKSQKTGAPYHVKKADGTVVPMQEWLRATLTDIERVQGKARTGK